jgi:hypothetical protein
VSRTSNNDELELYTGLFRNKLPISNKFGLKIRLEGIEVFEGAAIVTLQLHYSNIELFSNSFDDLN